MSDHELLDSGRRLRCRTIVAWNRWSPYSLYEHSDRRRSNPWAKVPRTTPSIRTAHRIGSRWKMAWWRRGHLLNWISGSNASIHPFRGKTTRFLYYLSFLAQNILQWRTRQHMAWKGVPGALRPQTPPNNHHYAPSTSSFTLHLFIYLFSVSNTIIAKKWTQKQFISYILFCAMKR